jgi:hypothetical protein
MMAHETLKLIIGLPTLKNELVLFKIELEFHKAYFWGFIMKYLREYNG